MKKILCPTDFSERSNDAYIFAQQVALTLRADLILFHASNVPIGISDRDYFRDPEELPANLQVENRRVLETWQQLKNSDSLEGRKINYDFIVAQGFPLTSIVKAIDKYEIDLVVMPTKADKRDNFEGLHLGSIGNQVIEEVNCPVMLIPPNVYYRELCKMVYAINLFDYNLNTVKKAVYFARKNKAKIIFHYMIRNNNVAEAERRREELKKRLHHEVEMDHVSFHLEKEKDLLKGINEFCEQEQADLLIMERHEKNILSSFLNRSLVKEVAYHTTIPVMVMHVSEQGL